jgi:hypothetical protein
MNQFNVVRQHVTFTAGDSFKITYWPSDIKKLEGSQTGPEPMFGMFKNESENGDIKNCKHWSTLVSEELSSAVENDVMRPEIEDEISQLQAEKEQLDKEGEGSKGSREKGKRSIQGNAKRPREARGQFCVPIG